MIELLFFSLGRRRVLSIGLICGFFLSVFVVGDLDAQGRRGPAGRSSPRTVEPSTPEQLGMDSAVLADAAGFFLAHRDDYNIHSFTVARNGVVVADGAFFPYQQGELHDIKSVTKVVTSTLIGIAIEEGYIVGVDERVVDFFPNRTIANMSAMKRRLTIEHLMTMSSGFGWVSGSEWEASNDWVQYVLDRPMAHEPGTVWEYIGGNSHLLSAILTEATGLSALEFAEQHLFGPLGIRRVHWLTDPQRAYTEGDGGLGLLPSEVVKIGQLMLQDGVWEGQRILPEGWVDAATSPSAADENFGYNWHHGYVGRWWFFGAHGASGQRLLVCPENDVILYLSGGGGLSNVIDTRYFHATETWVLPAFQSYGPLPEDPDAHALLEGAFETARISTDETYASDPLPPVANEIDGRSYVLEENGYGLQTVTFFFGGDDEVVLRVTTDGGPFEDNFFEWPIGLDGEREFGRGRHGFLAANFGRWVNDQTLTLHIDEVGYVDQWDIDAIFDSDEITIVAQGVIPGTQEEPVTFYGVLED